MSYETLLKAPLWVERLCDGRAWSTYMAQNKRTVMVSIWPSPEHPGFWFYSVISAGDGGGVSDSAIRPVSPAGLHAALFLAGVDATWPWTLSEKVPTRKPGAFGKRRGELVYFIKAGPYVKIGYSVDVDARMSQLRTGCPFALELLGTVDGGREVEAELHARFSALRLRVDGEWFAHRDDLAAFIESLQSQQEGA